MVQGADTERNMLKESRLVLEDSTSMLNEVDDQRALPN